MVKTYLKTFARMFKKHLTRLVSIFLMVLVSVGFSAGIGMGKDALFFSLSDYYKAHNVSDLIVRGSEEISEEKMDALRAQFGEENVVRGGIVEIEGGELAMGPATLKLTGDGIGEGVTRLYIQSAADGGKQNLPTQKEATMSEGEPHENTFYIAAERASRDIAGVPLGTTITAAVVMGGRTLYEYKFTVTEHVAGALHFTQAGDTSMQKTEGGGEDDYELLENILYIQTDETHPLPFPMNEAYISVPNLKAMTTLFDSGYEKQLAGERAAAEAIFKDEIDAESCAILTLHENYTFRE